MERVVRWKTKDGILHDTPLKAERHAENLYGLALSKLAGKLVYIEKYKAMHEYLDANLQAFIDLAALKADIELKEDHSDHD